MQPAAADDYLQSQAPVRREMEQCSRVVGAAGPSCGLGQRIPIVGGVNVRSDLPSGTSARAPSSNGADGIS